MARIVRRVSPDFAITRDGANCRVKIGDKNLHLIESEYNAVQQRAVQIYYSPSEWGRWTLRKALFWTCWPVKILSSSGMTVFNCDYSASRIIGIGQNSPVAIIILSFLLPGSLFVNTTTRWRSMSRIDMFGTRKLLDVIEHLIREEHAEEVDDRYKLNTRQKAVYFLGSTWGWGCAVSIGVMDGIIKSYGIQSLGARLEFPAAITKTLATFVFISSVFSRFSFFGLPLIENIQKLILNHFVGVNQHRVSSLTNKQRWGVARIGVGIVCILFTQFFILKNATTGIRCFFSDNLTLEECRDRDRDMGIFVASLTVPVTLTETLMTQARASYYRLVAPLEGQIQSFSEQRIVFDVPKYCYLIVALTNLDWLQFFYFGLIGNISTVRDVSAKVLCMETIVEQFKDMDPCFILVLGLAVLSYFSASLYRDFVTRDACNKSINWCRDHPLLCFGPKASEEDVLASDPIIHYGTDSFGGTFSSVSSVSRQRPVRSADLDVDELEMEAFARLTYEG